MCVPPRRARCARCPVRDGRGGIRGLAGGSHRPRRLCPRSRGYQDRGIAIGDLSFLTLYDRAPRGHRPRHVSARYRSRPAYRWARGLSSRRHHHVRIRKPDKEIRWLLFSYAAAHAEVEVDSETGLVDVRHFLIATDCGCAINPFYSKGNSRVARPMGIDHALREDTRPPTRPDRGITLDLTEYADLDGARRSRNRHSRCGTSGSKRPFRCQRSWRNQCHSSGPAICNAIFDAVGVRITALPATPERVLAGLMAQREEKR